MQTGKIILMDDGVNKKGIIFPIATLERMLDEAYKTGTPSCISKRHGRS
jgi:hypothetical protein